MALTYSPSRPAELTLAALLTKRDWLLPNNQRQRRTLHFQKDVLPYALC